MCASEYGTTRVKQLTDTQCLFTTPGMYSTMRRRTMTNADELHTFYEVLQYNVTLSLTLQPLHKLLLLLLYMQCRW
jgi:hypothetical protein